MKKFTIAAVASLCVCIGSAFAITCFDDELKGIKSEFENVASISFEVEENEFMFEYGKVTSSIEVSESLDLSLKFYSKGQGNSVLFGFDAYNGDVLIKDIDSFELCTMSVEYTPGASAGSYEGYEDVDLESPVYIVAQYLYGFNGSCGASDSVWEYAFNEGLVMPGYCDEEGEIAYPFIASSYYLNTIEDIMTPITSEQSSMTLYLGDIFNSQWCMECSTFKDYDNAVALIEDVCNSSFEIAASVELGYAG